MKPWPDLRFREVRIHQNRVTIEEHNERTMVSPISYLNMDPYQTAGRRSEKRKIDNDR